MASSTDMPPLLSRMFKVDGVRPIFIPPHVRYSEVPCHPCLRTKHPQLFVLLFSKLYPKTCVLWPQSHKQFQIELPSVLRRNAIDPTVNLVYLEPISIIVFIYLPLLDNF